MTIILSPQLYTHQSRGDSHSSPAPWPCLPEVSWAQPPVL